MPDDVTGEESGERRDVESGTGATGGTGDRDSGRRTAEGAPPREPAVTSVPGGTTEESGKGTAARPGGSSQHTPLLPHDECDKLALRLQHAVGGFVDGPRAAVEEADHVLEEVASRFAEAVARRRRTLRASWQESGEGAHPTADTEQLRLALRDYRETTERLLRI